MESVRDEVTLGDIEAHSKRHGRKATSQLLNLLGRKRPLYDIVMSKEGQVLFSSLIARLDELLEQIIDNKATDKESMEYRISVKFLREMAEILRNYKKHSDMLKGVK